jgi:hypothetical protein
MNASVPTKPPDTKITNSKRKIQNCNSKFRVFSKRVAKNRGMNRMVHTRGMKQVYIPLTLALSRKGRWNFIYSPSLDGRG